MHQIGSFVSRCAEKEKDSVIQVELVVGVT